MTKRTVLVTDANQGSAIAIIRSLGRQGMRVIAADSYAESPGLRSRYATRALVYPPPERRCEEFIDTLLEASERESIDLIIPVTESAIVPLAEQRERFTAKCKLALPDAVSAAIASNKLETLRLAASLGIPIPRTIPVRTEDEAETAARELGWPLVLKPLASRVHHRQGDVRSFKVSYAGNELQLRRELRKYTDQECEVVLQEYYPGEGQGVELLTNRGEPLAVFQHRRLREVPIHGGASAYRESMPLSPQLYEWSTGLLKRLKWSGLAMIEYKIGADGPKLMEINGRVWGSMPLAVHAGVNFPAMLAKLHLDSTAALRTPAAGNYAIGVRSRNLGLDLTWITAVLFGTSRYPFLTSYSRKDGLSALLSLLNPRVKFDVLSLYDPFPGIIEVRAILAELYEKMCRHFSREADHDLVIPSLRPRTTGTPVA